ncbi:hypothetical protein [Bradyrhizobium sp. Bra78]|uniref:hypothetical protein n=1 Tax=Bradyrhizobium sp. Bra78 TaxID=2926010 RepID=UPI0021C841E4|nr:hypothetical protein [Bradyrhizobium sp. Bra78]
MTGGLLDHLVEASHISAGIGCTLDEAMEIVRAAHAESTDDQDEATPPTGNVIYGVDFAARRRTDNDQLA